MNHPTHMQPSRSMPRSVSTQIHSHLQTRRFVQCLTSRAWAWLTICALAAWAVSFQSFAATATIRLHADNSFVLFHSIDDSVSGTQIAAGISAEPGGTGVTVLGQHYDKNDYSWEQSRSESVSLVPGRVNYLLVAVVDQENGKDASGNPIPRGIGGFLADVSLSDGTFRFADGTGFTVTGSPNWNASDTPINLGGNGVGPWGPQGDVSSTASWIWAGDAHTTDIVIFWIDLIPQNTTATIRLHADNSFVLSHSTNDSVNGAEKARGIWGGSVTVLGQQHAPNGYSWDQSRIESVTLIPGQVNYLHIAAVDQGGIGGFLADVSLSDGTFSFADGTDFTVTGSPNWRASVTGFNSYGAPINLGGNGVGPWGLQSDLSPTAQWIWAGDAYATDIVFFSIAIIPRNPTATIRLHADNSFVLFRSTDDSVVGTQIVGGISSEAGGTGVNVLGQHYDKNGYSWEQSRSESVSLVPGRVNYLHIAAVDQENEKDANGNPISGVLIGGFLADVSLSDGTFKFADGTGFTVTGSPNWNASVTGFNTYGAPINLGGNGVGPWGPQGDVDSTASWIWAGDAKATEIAYLSVAIIPSQKATPVITWQNPAPILVGTALSAAQLNATADVPGRIVYTPGSGEILPAGTRTLTAMFIPTDTTRYYTVSKQVTLIVQKVTATVTLGNLIHTFSGQPKSATATTTPAGLTVVLTYTYRIYNSRGLVGTSVSETPPTAVGAYAVVGTIIDSNYEGSASGTLIIGPGLLPIAHAQSVTTAEGIAIPITLTGTDPEGATLTRRIIGSPRSGSLTGSGMNLVYTPNQNFNGTDSFEFSVSDLGPDITRFSPPAQVSIMVTPVDSQPIIQTSVTRLAIGYRQTAEINITIWDEKPIDWSRVRWSSSNQSVLPNTGVVLRHYYAGNRYVVVIDPETAGEVSLTISYSDGSLVATHAIDLVSSGAYYVYRPPSGVVIHGYVAQATVFFDANKNGLQDANEFTATTDDWGNYQFDYEGGDFDTNGNGVLDPSEGRLVATGGLDIATGLLLAMPLTAPGETFVISPLTTLADQILTRNPALSLEQADAQITSALGLSAETAGRVSVFGYDPFAVIGEDPDAGPVQAAAAKVYDTVVQSAALLDGASNASTSEITSAVLNAMAARIQTSGQLNLSSGSSVAELIQTAAPAVNATIPPNAIQAAAAVIAEVNAIKDDTVSSTSTLAETLVALTQAQQVAQARIAPALAQLGAGQLSVEELKAPYSGDALKKTVAAAPVGKLTGFDTAPGVIMFERDAFRVREDGQPLEAITLVRRFGTDGEINVLVRPSDGTATIADGDYVGDPIEVRFASGEILKTIDLSGRLHTDGLIEGDETLQLTVEIAPGSVKGAQVALPDSATVTIVDGDSPGAFSWGAAEYQVQENQSVSLVVIRSGGTANQVTLIATPVAITAAAGSDFAATPVTVTFPPGVGTRLVTIPVLKDPLAEGNENFSVTLSLANGSPAGAALGETAAATVTILDVPNTAPIANTRTVITSEDTPVTFTLTGQDSQNDSLTFTVLSSPAHGALSGTAPNLVFAPSPNFNGTDSFTFKVNDGSLDSAPATISIVVNPVNDPPVVANPIVNQAGVYGSAFSLTVPANTFADVDAGQNLTYTAAGLPPGISFDAANRTLSGTPTSPGIFSALLTATDDGTPTNLSVSALFTFTVSKAALTVTANNQTKVYGAALPALTASYDGFVNGDTPASLDTPATVSTTATAASNVGTYPITASGAADANYTISFVAGALTVDPATLLISADAKNKVYGAELPALTASYTGFVNSDAAASLDTPASLSTTATASSNVGIHPITASGAADVNYAIVFAPGTLTVTSAPLTVAADDKSKAYGAAVPVLTASYTGFVNGDSAANLDTPASLSTTATASSNAGTYPISVGAAVDANYTISFVPGTLAVDKSALSVIADDKARAYGAANPTFTGVITGVQNNDAITASYASASMPGSVVGTYPIVPTLVDPDSKLSNYSVSSQNGTLTITPVPLTVMANDAARDYGQANPPLTGTLVGVVNNDKLTATYSTAATPSSPVDSYPIVPSLFDLESKLGNYTVTKINGTLTVKNVAPVVNAGPDQEKVALDEVTFAGSFTDPSSPSHVVGWDFGDGSPALIGTLTPTHTYAKHGTYTVTLTVTDSHLASASDTLTVTVISSLGCATEARDGLMPFVKESKRIEKAVKDLTASLEPKLWLDEVHLDPKGGRKAFVYWRQATDMMEQLLKPSNKRDSRDEDEDEDDEEFTRTFNDSMKDTLSAAAITAIQQALADVICASRLISETLYLENEHLVALDPRRQKHVDADLARAKEYLEKANALAEQGDFGKAVRFHIRSWNNTLEAMEAAGRSQPAKELAKAMELIDESLDPKYWTDEPSFLHLELMTGQKVFNLMQAAARELANVVQDAAKGRVIAAVGQQAADELADLLERARIVSRTLYAENANLRAVNPKNQKAVDADLKRAKEDLDKGVAAEAANDFDKGLSHYANAWDDTVRAIEDAAKR